MSQKLTDIRLSITISNPEGGLSPAKLLEILTVLENVLRESDEEDIRKLCNLIEPNEPTTSKLLVRDAAFHRLTKFNNRRFLIDQTFAGKEPKFGATVSATAIDIFTEAYSEGTGKSFDFCGLYAAMEKLNEEKALYIEGLLRNYFANIQIRAFVLLELPMDNKPQGRDYQTEDQGPLSPYIIDVTLKLREKREVCSLSESISCNQNMA